MARIRRLTMVAAVAGIGMAQDIPRINPNGVVPSRSDYVGPMTPGINVSVYGKRLGPGNGCTAANGGWPEVKELCGTSVAVAGRRAALLYVQDRQINLRVPYDVPTEGDVPFVVVVNGRASRAVGIRFSPYAASIRHSGDAYVGMPIWIEIHLPEPLRHSLRYPVTIWPTDFGGHTLEVRRRGTLLRAAPPPQRFPRAGNGPCSFGSIGCGGLIGLPHEPKNGQRLPLHLAYRLDEPGEYDVRYVGYDFRYSREKHVLARSPWTPLRVRPYPLAKRQAWLESMRDAQPNDPVEWLTSYLPSVLAVADRAALSLLEPALYDADALVRDYGLYALALFDPALLQEWAPRTIRERGPTPQLGYLISWGRPMFQSRGGEIARAAISHLKASSPLITAGALQTLYFMKPHYDWSRDPEIPELMDRAVVGAAEHLIQTHDPTVLQPLALYLGTWKSDTSRVLLRRLVAEGTVREQAEICLRWIAEAPRR